MMRKSYRVKPLPHPKNGVKAFSVPKAPKVPTEPTKEEIKEQEANLEKLWKHVHGHTISTKPPIK